MQDNNFNKDLCILINENNTHWNIIIHNSEIVLINILDNNLVNNIINNKYIKYRKKLNDKNKEKLNLKEKDFSLDEVNRTKIGILNNDLLKEKNKYHKNLINLELNSNIDKIYNNYLNNKLNSQSDNNNTKYNEGSKDKNIKDNYIQKLKNNFIDDKTIDIVCSFKKLSVKQISNLLNDNNKIIKYGDIFRYLYNKKYNNNQNLYPNYITNIKDKKIRNNKKRMFRKACKSYSIDNNKLLWQVRKYKDLFEGKLKIFLKKPKFIKEYLKHIYKFYSKILYFLSPILCLLIFNYYYYSFHV